MTSSTEYDSKIAAAIRELKTLIQARWPSATFAVSRGEDNAEAVHLNTTVDVDDTDDVLDLVMNRLLELQIDDGLPIHVIPIRPLERVLAELRSENENGRRRVAQVIVTA